MARLGRVCAAIDSLTVQFRVSDFRFVSGDFPLQSGKVRQRFSAFVYRAKTPRPAIKARELPRQSRNTRQSISDFPSVQNHVFRGKSMQIAPLGGKLVGTNTGTPVSVLVVSLDKPNR